jgi:hypothetical protein
MSMRELEKQIIETFNEDNQIIAELRQQLAEVTNERDLLKVYIACIHDGQVDHEVLWLPETVRIGTSTYSSGWVNVRTYPHLKKYCVAKP